MKTEELNYYLPENLIAQQPVKNRTDSRLLVLDRKTPNLLDTTFDKIADFISPGDCLVLNDTKVLPARFFAKRETGAKLEGLFLEQTQKDQWLVMLKGQRKVKTGETILLKEKNSDNFIPALIEEKKDKGTCLIKPLTDDPTEKILERIGYPPLPPYIKRDQDIDQANIDQIRYQTVYAQNAGAVAAPTAGLHFTKELLKQLKTKGVSIAFVTLHVGAGTFKPVTTENLEDHKIHKENFSIDAKNAQLINQTKENGSKIIAVGTTSVRVLETLAKNLPLKPTSAATDLFLMPGSTFNIVDAIITNFHLPGSTLIALVAAFAGLEKTRNAYKHAVEQKYRFYSYGDAMMIL